MKQMMSAVSAAEKVCLVVFGIQFKTWGSQGALEGMRIVIGKDDQDEDGNENSPKLVVRPFTNELHSSTGLSWFFSDGEVISFEVLMAGELKKRDGVMRKKWIDVYVELRENSLTCFHSKEDRQLLDTVMAVDKNEIFAISIKKTSSKGPSLLSKDLLIGSERMAERDRWLEMIEACCQKARLVQEEAAAKGRAEADELRKVLEECAAQRHQEVGVSNIEPKPIAGTAEGSKNTLSSRFMSSLQVFPSSLQKPASAEKQAEVEEMGLDSENSWNSMLTEANRQLRELQDELMREKAKSKVLEETLGQVLDNDDAKNDSAHGDPAASKREQLVQGLQQQNIENNNLRLQNDNLTTRNSELQSLIEVEKNKLKLSENENAQLVHDLQDVKAKLDANAQNVIELERVKDLEGKLEERDKESGLAAEQGQR
eukprot:364599-Hanusia_phi.AAC.1